MKRLLTLILFLFLLPISASATTAVTGKIQNLGTGNLTSNTFARFWLRGCGGNNPRINGTSIIGPSQGGVYFFDLIADSSGNITGTLYSTRDSTGLLAGDIECGGSKLSEWYGLQIYVAGKGGPEMPIHAKSGISLDITTVTPIASTPAVVAPNGDSVYARIDAANLPFTGIVSINTTDAGVTGANAALIALTNSNIVETSYIIKHLDGSLIFSVDGGLIPGKGYLAFNRQGGNSTGDIDLRSGSNGAALYCNTIANIGIPLPQSSCQIHMFTGGIGTAKFNLHSGSPNNWDQWWDAGTGCSTWFSNNSTTTGATLCGPASAANSTVATGNQCGTIAANGACANTAPTNFHCVVGSATLATGASTITGISPAFANTNFTVQTNDITTITNGSKGVPASVSSITFTGTGSDTIAFTACGG
jgi:hypothetical protein